MKRILVIDDQENLRQLYEEIFTQAGYKVVACKNGLDGLEQASIGGFTAIITDLKMPGKDGLELLQDLKDSTPQEPNGPIFVISSVSYPFAKDEVMRRGAAGFILKDTMEPKEILETVEAAIQ